MLIDMHMHEGRFSKDSFLKLEDMVVLARQRGLDAICITDHDSMGLWDFAHEYSEKVDFPIFVGVEYYSLDGDLVTYGIREFPKERIPAQEFVDYVVRQGGACFAAHPFRNNNRGLEEKILTVQGLAGAEVLNGSTSPAANLLAARCVQKRGLSAVGSSDCHVPEKLGRFATYIGDKITCEEDIVKALKNGHTLPAYYTPQGYRIWDMERPLVTQQTIAY